MNQAKESMEEKILQSNIWWSENALIPSRNLKDNFGTTTNLTTATTTTTTIMYVCAPTPDMKPDDRAGLKLPAIKDFGRQRSHRSFRGWGRKGQGPNAKFELSESGAYSGLSCPR